MGGRVWGQNASGWPNRSELGGVLRTEEARLGHMKQMGAGKIEGDRRKR